MALVATELAGLAARGPGCTAVRDATIWSRNPLGHVYYVNILLFENMSFQFNYIHIQRFQSVCMRIQYT